MNKTKTSSLKLLQFANIILIMIVLNLAFINSYSQSKPDTDKLIPKQALNSNIIVSPLPESMVNVSIDADIIETQACSSESISQGGLKIELNWYNSNDFTGNMMMGMMSEKSEKNWLSHKKQINELYEHYKNPVNSISCSSVKEEVISGGKLYIIEYSYSYCDTDKTENRMVEARCFFFKGNVSGNIEIKCQCSQEEVKEMIKVIIQSSSDFNFSGLLN